MAKDITELQEGRPRLDSHRRRTSSQLGQLFVENGAEHGHGRGLQGVRSRGRRVEACGQLRGGGGVDRHEVRGGSGEAMTRKTLIKGASAGAVESAVFICSTRSSRNASSRVSTKVFLRFSPGPAHARLQLGDAIVARVHHPQPRAHHEALLENHVSKK